MGYLKLWKWIEEGRGHGEAHNSHKLTNRQQEQRLRESFVSVRRVREWRDIHSQLHTVVAEHGWRLNTAPATYEQVHLAMLAGLLGNIGCKSDDEDWYLGARGVKFWRHPGAHLSKKPGRWLVAAELVETTRLFGRGLAAIEPTWIPPIAGHLLKTQLLEPHWEKKAGEVVALERATLYGIVIYNNKRVNFGRVDLPAAREIFIREALVQGDWDTKLPFLAHNQKLIAQVQELEHKSRRQDVLVDDELIHAFYDQQLPQDVCSGPTLESWYREEVKKQPKLLHLTREELMRHEAAGITTAAFPKTLRLGGIDCSAVYLHEPGDAKDGVTVTVPIYALNQVSDERCEWLVPGMLQAKVLALCKTLHQRPRSRLVPLPDYAAEFCDHRALRPGRPDRRAAEGRARAHAAGGAAQRLQARPAAAAPVHELPRRRRTRPPARHGPRPGQPEGRAGRPGAQCVPGAGGAEGGGAARRRAHASWPLRQVGAVSSAQVQPPAAAAPAEAQRHTAWTFGELPELMEVRRGGQTLIGFPALIDHGTHVEIEVFDEPDVAAARHRAGLRRLVALQIKEPLKYLEKNIPDLPKMGAAFMGLGGTLEELREQIIDLALDRAFLADPLPTDERSFKARIDEGRTRLNLIAAEVARLAGTVLAEHATALRKLKDSKPPKDVADDVAAQLQRLVPKRFLLATAWAPLQHLPRYLKAVTLRLDKLRADPARDATRLAELRPLEQRYLRRAGRAEGRAARAAGRVPLAAGGAARQPVRAGAAHAAAGQRQAARQGLATVGRLSPLVRVCAQPTPAAGALVAPYNSAFAVPPTGRWRWAPPPAAKRTTSWTCDCSRPPCWCWPCATPRAHRARRLHRPHRPATPRPRSRRWSARSARPTARGGASWKLPR